MGKASRDKGKRGELECSRLISAIFGIEAERSARNGVDQAEDIHHGIAGLHVECKRVERLNVLKAMLQASEAAKGKIPTLWHRCNRGPWLITIMAQDLDGLVELINAHREKEAKS